MAITNAVTDLVSSIYELLASFVGAVYTIVHSFVMGIFSLFAGFFAFIADIFKGVFDIAGGVGKFVTGKLLPFSFLGPSNLVLPPSFRLPVFRNATESSHNSSQATSSSWASLARAHSPTFDSRSRASSRRRGSVPSPRRRRTGRAGCHSNNTISYL